MRVAGRGHVNAGRADTEAAPVPRYRWRRRRRTPRLGVAGALLAVAVLLLVGASSARVANTSPPAVGMAPATTTPTVRGSQLLAGGGMRSGLPPVGRPSLLVGASAITVPILYYHFFRVDTNPRDRLGIQLSVTPQQFAAQMAVLHAAGAHTVSLEDVMAALEGHRSLPPHSVVLTFDDGYSGEDTVALPVLQQYGFVATCFIVPAFLDRPQYLTTAQLLDLSSHGMVIGAHTMDHVDLVAEPPDVAAYEIDASRTALQDVTGQPVLDFAYPYGALDPAVSALVEQAGFRDAVSTHPGPRQSLAGRFGLRRTEIVGDDTVWSFAVKALLPPLGDRDHPFSLGGMDKP